MAKADRNANTRADLTGESYQQALEWIRTHGLTTGPVPDATSTEQQILEAAVLRALARPPLPSDDALFGIARTSPGVDSLTLWPARGAATAVLARLLPVITAGTRTGVPTLRAVRGPGKDLTLSVVGPARLLVRATPADHRAARDLVTALGHRLLEDAPDDGELAAWRMTKEDLAHEAQQWSTALRRVGLFLGATPDWTRRAPSADETGVPAELTAARPHGPTVKQRPMMTVALTASHGGEGRSTIACALAEEFARAGSSVLLLSADQFAQEALQRGGFEPWPAGESAGPVRGRVATAFWDERNDTELVLQARRTADIVVLDTHFDYRPGVVPVDVEVAVSRYRSDAWQDHVADDQRPRETRLLNWLDMQFTHFRNELHGTAGPEERAQADLLAYLDDNFLRYVRARESGVDADVYDRTDLAAVDDFWAMDYGLDYNRGGDRLPAEDHRPLDEWRRQYITFIDPDGHERHPALWPQLARQWAERSRRRNQEHLQPTDMEAADLHRALEDYLSFITPDGIERWGDDFPAARERFKDAVVHRWLARTGEAYIDTRPKPALDTLDELLLVLDVRFADYAEQRLQPTDDDPAELFDVLDDDVVDEPAQAVWRYELQSARAMDEWWSLKVVQHLSGVGPEEDEGPLDDWRAAFLEQIDVEGARRHPDLWDRARTTWAPRNRERNQAGLVPHDDTLEDRRRWMAEYTEQVTDLADRVWGHWWRAAAAAWTSGQGPVLEDMDDHHLVTLVPVEREPLQTAALLQKRSRPGHDVTVLAVNAAPQDLAPERVDAVDTILRDQGLAGLATVPDSRAMQDVLFNRRATGGSPAAGIEALARMVTASLGDPQN